MGKYTDSPSRTQCETDTPLKMKTFQKIKKGGGDALLDATRRGAWTLRRAAVGRHAPRAARVLRAPGRVRRAGLLWLAKARLAKTRRAKYPRRPRRVALWGVDSAPHRRRIRAPSGAGGQHRPCPPSSAVRRHATSTRPQPPPQGPSPPGRLRASTSIYLVYACRPRSIHDKSGSLSP